ncbi:MAG: flagellar biosynthesis anti-sigma factor FlgM [Deltaproteobacteria bacterium]|nr:flagellar biosynthesis anti-sigma factor FlgM [Deltaproteobacteria bacterium]MBT8358842.1 flagellar biosynthesis anti-sigma factor FlgM [Deltaproteobacteria bacterium]MBT8374927.1 flagellar biosynthesis anti-sigma factor FlgM [Deltaproteobacteria bacterium]NNK86347.1 flagellar biosynthesis anti-sigma factor FlgM [Desulfobacterales bacterium]NNL42289.1 flagellar biosynthesis anti-sigma factor FlgM [Desulfobacterales bacterium]
MKITDNNSSLNIRNYVDNIKDNKKIDDLTKQGSPQTVKEDKVVLSPKAKEVQEATKLIKELPDIREDKVAKLKEQVDQGTYKVDGKKIAFKMLKESILDELL